MNKICICGDTRAGKTTFLKALTKINGYPYFISDPEWAENREFYESGVVATSGYSHLKGVLLFSEDKRYPVEFLDYPGEDFHESFVLNGQKPEKLSRFISEGSFLYFFIEPEKVNTRNMGALINLLHFFRICHVKQGKGVHVCLVLSKADTCSVKDLPQHTPEFVEFFIESKAPGILETIRSHCDSFSCCAISAKGEEMDAESRQVFFEQYFRKEDTRKRNWNILAIIAVIAAALSICFGAYAYNRYEENATEMARQEIAAFEKKAMVTVNVDNLKDTINTLKQMNDPDGRIHEIEAMLKEKVKKNLESEIERLLQVLIKTLNAEDLRRYNDAVSKYTNLFGKLPDDLIFNPGILDLRLIRNILSIGNSGMQMYTMSRVEAIAEFCEKSVSLTTREKYEIESSLKTARMIASRGAYEVKVSYRGFKELEVEVTLSTYQYTEDQSDEIVFTGDYSERYNLPFKLEWKVGDGIYLSIWEDSDLYGASPDECVYMRRLSNHPAQVAIHDFCRTGWFKGDGGEPEDVSVCELSFSVTDPEGNPLTEDRLNQVYKYVYGNAFWEELEQRIMHEND